MHRVVRFEVQGRGSSRSVLTSKIYQSRRDAGGNPHRETPTEQQVLLSVVGGGPKVNPWASTGQKVRVGCRKLAGGPQRNTERQSVSSVLQWARWRAGPEGSDCAVVGWLVS